MRVTLRCSKVSVSTFPLAPSWSFNEPTGSNTMANTNIKPPSITQLNNTPTKKILNVLCVVIDRGVLREGVFGV